MIRRLRYYISLLMRGPSLAVDRFAIRHLGLAVYRPAELQELGEGAAQSLKEAVALLALHDQHAHHLLNVAVTEIVISPRGGWIETCGPVLVLPAKALKLGPPRLAAVLARKVIITRLARRGLPWRFVTFAKLMRSAYARAKGDRHQWHQGKEAFRGIHEVARHPASSMNPLILGIASR